MKLSKCILLINFLLMINFSGFAQKKTFDIVSYTTPKGWTEKQDDGNISYSRIDGDSWAQIAIYQHSNSTGDIQTDFDKEWNELVAANKTISSSEKTKPQTAEGWTVMSGSGVWQYNGANVASVLTVYSNNSVCVSVLCNATAKPYLKEYQTLLGTLDLDAGNAIENPAKENNSNSNTSSANSSNGPVTGLWTYYTLETNGYQQYTAGYMRREYLFKEDGTYIFRRKNWLTLDKNILYVYESGTYSVNGNQLTITPSQGKGQFWSKTSSTKEWGKLIKSTDYKPEKVTYTFQIIDDATYGNGIVLKPGKPTERDGGKFNAANDPYEFRYSFRKLESLIDNPPGFKTDAENKTTVVQPENTSNANNNAAVAGTWSQSSSSNPFGQSLSGGYTTMQYTFNNNGTYEYVAKTFSQSMSYIILSKESGQYSIAGNKLTITPTEGSTNSFTKKAGDADQPDKLIKTEKRPLEKTVYTFTSYYFSGIKETNLVLQNDKETFRDGKHSTNTLFANAWYYKPVSASNPKIKMP